MRKFMRTRQSAPPPAPPVAPPVAPLNGHAIHTKLNGHANGIGNGVRRDDQHSTLSSRYWGGSGGSGAGSAGRGGELWQDTEFPPTWRSVGDKRLGQDVVWMRPHELSTMPVFRGDGAGGESAAESGEELAARWHVAPGALGDPALCAAAAALALTPRLLTRVIPPHSFRDNYTGAFRFKFWVFGAWQEVMVDDQLPTRAGCLLSSQCSHRNDFTLPLLEKAYAKLYGSYVALRGAGCGGGMSRALQELSGGVVQSFPLARQPRALSFRVLNSSVPRSSLLVAAISPAPPRDWRRLRSGLITGQPYCITGLARVRAGGGCGSEGAGAGALVRVRAAGGRGEWGGAWARGSPEWRALPEHDRDLLAHRATHPAEFWMSFSDFASSFTELVLVHVGPDDWMLEPALHGKRPWRCVLARRRWRSGYNAGGDPSCTETTSANPQFHVQIPCVTSGGKCHVVVSVTQQYRPRGAQALHSIGFAVYEAGAAATRARHAALHDLRALDVTHESRARETATFFTLPPGDYLLVPHTRRPHTDAAFLLRILTDEQTNIWEVNEDNVIIRNISSEFMEEQLIMPMDVQATLGKLLGKEQADELDARGVQRVLAGVWRACLCARPTLELCRALVMLRDAAIQGRMPARELPPLVAALAFWKHVYWRVGAAGGGGGGACRAARVSAYRLRALLWAAGVSASNKVLECLVLRYARRLQITHEHYVLALARLHLAHERYRNLESKMKSNPLSLEEMILMTIYS